MTLACTHCFLPTPQVTHLRQVPPPKQERIQESYPLTFHGVHTHHELPTPQVTQGDKYRLYNKGAAEWVLQKCVSMYNTEGKVVPMTEAALEDVMQVG